MNTTPLIHRLNQLPSPAEPQRAKISQKKLEEQLKVRPDHKKYLDFMADYSEVTLLLDAIFGNSTFLTQCLMRNSQFFFEILKNDPSVTLDFLINGIKWNSKRAASGTNETEFGNITLKQLMSDLRFARERVALLIAITDIGNVWPLDQITNNLSNFADAAISLATNWLLLNAAKKGDLLLNNNDNPSFRSGFVILALGKLGSQELNYSSDVDLIALYDQEEITYVGTESPHDCFCRLTQYLVQILTERTADGYVFRTDFRLRPDAGATPLAISMVAAETYYESVGQNWERAAMIKARPVAGDWSSGHKFLEQLSPFVWRKNLDYAAIKDIQSIKRQIDSKGRRGEFKIPGHNIKLGIGGIREIELFAQTQQLIAGGRDPSLRNSTTSGALEALATSNRITKQVKEELLSAYQFLRTVEHRLQMVSDEQTHTLPKDSKSLALFSIFLGYQSPEAFGNELMIHVNSVRNHYKELFKESSALGSDAGNLVFTGSEDDPGTIQSLKDMGYLEGDVVTKTIRDWHHGRYRATRSTRSREILTDIIPVVLKAIAATPSPDISFRRFDRFLSRLPEGVQLFSLFQSNPELLTLVAEVIGIAPKLAEFLENNPHVLDAILSNQFGKPHLPTDSLEKDLKSVLDRSRDYQDILDFSRRWARENRFQIGTQILENKLFGQNASKSFSNIAVTVIRCLLPIITQEFEENHGQIHDGKYAIVGLGTLGSREMIFSSDLDLIFIYDSSEKNSQSNGKIPLPPSKYYARLSQKFINAITAVTAEGRIYEIDMRLRPSGQAGPVATSLSSFVEYHSKSAWTWERMALTKAQPIAGNPNLCTKIEQNILDILTAPCNTEMLTADVINMRNRIEKEFPADSIWQLKYIRGGLLDCEFIAQYCQLLYATNSPEILVRQTASVFNALSNTKHFSPEIAQKLNNQMSLQHNLYSLLDLCLQKNLKGTTVPPELVRLLADVACVANIGELNHRLREAQTEVIMVYNNIIS